VLHFCHLHAGFEMQINRMKYAYAFVFACDSSVGNMRNDRKKLRLRYEYINLLFNQWDDKTGIGV
jgi:hypothetical protein